MRGLLVGLVLVVGVGLAACPAPEGECTKNQDCPSGQACNRDNQCVNILVPPPDAGARRDVYVGIDTFDAGFEDTGPEDAAAEDGAPDAALPDQGVPDAATAPDAALPDSGPAQVSQFTVCDQPSALALSADQSELFVGCVQDDRVQVYGSVGGTLVRRLTSLATPCQPFALHLREDKNQLWVSCQAPPQAKVLNVRPSNGQLNQTAITGTADPRVRFASGSNLLAWTTVQSSSYSLYSISSTTATSIGGGLLLTGGGVAVRVDGSAAYFTQQTTTGNNLYCVDQTNGPLACNLFTPFSAATLLSISPAHSSLPASARNVLLAASGQTFVRLNQNGQVAPAVNTGQGLTRAMTVQPDGRFFYLAVFNAMSGDSRVLQITSDTATTVSAATEQSVVACELADLAAADDGRVFVACADGDSVKVLQF